MKVGAVGKKCSEAELAYIAGFLDADGAIMAVVESHSEKKYKFRVRVAVKITQHDRRILDWIRKVCEAGVVRANRSGKKGQTYDLHIRNRNHVQNILQLLIPYLRVKKRQAILACEILKTEINSSRDLINNARKADTLSTFNVRSKNRRKNFATKIEERFSPND